MKKQKVVITDSEININAELDAGWKITSVVSQHVSISTATSGVDSYTCNKLVGKFCFILEKD